jgi:hypothetical protein
VATAQQIRINQLLLEREALFARIYACEQAAAKLLGAAYPWERPVLPSDQRTKRRPGAARAAAGARDPLRRLEPGEVAFRVTYQQFGREVSEEHDDHEALRGLLAGQTAQLQVWRVETIDAAGAPVALLVGPAPLRIDGA